MATQSTVGLGIQGGGNAGASQEPAAAVTSQGGVSPEYRRAYQDAMQDAMRAVMQARPEGGAGEASAEAGEAGEASAEPDAEASAEAEPAPAAQASLRARAPPLVSPTGAPGPDVISAVCAVRDPADGSYALARQVGLPPEICDAWAGMDERERDACVHTFQFANTADLSMPQAAVCAASLDSARLTERELLQCVRAEGGLPEGRCTRELRAALVLADNAPIGDAMLRLQARAAQRSTGERESVRQIREIIEKATPQQSDVFDLMALCRWDRAGPRDARANEILTETYLALPAAERAICNEGNADCATLDSIQDMCHSVQHRMGSNAFVAKVDDFYGAGGFTDASQLLQSSMELYPEPYGSAFSEMLIACESDKTQADVARTLLSSNRGSVVRHREICRRLDEGHGALPRMTPEMAAVAAMKAM